MYSILGLFALAGGPVFAHGGASAKDLWAYWSFDPLIIIGLLLAILLYVRGWRMLAGRTQKPSPALKRRAWWFAGGMGTLIIALISPVDGLAEELFSMHMVQHNLLMLVAAPLLVLSYPLPDDFTCTPGADAAGDWARLAEIWLAARFLAFAQPAAGRLAAAGRILWIWHAPVLYQAALENDGLHAVEHLCFLGSAPCCSGG